MRRDKMKRGTYVISAIAVVIIILITVVIVVTSSGCSFEDTPTVTDTSIAPQDVAKAEQKDQQQNQAGLVKAQPATKLDWSLERDQLDKRNVLWNDPNKISYIYLMSYGKVMAFYTIKGKVSSVNSSLTGAEQIVKDPNIEGYGEGHYSESLLMESPDYDGSYGDNGAGVFFFCTDGTYVEWNGEYMLCDRPLKLATQPELVRQVD
jgi:hypothetical protein